MIKLINADKYFFKNNKNEIHVINNTNLDMEGKGLIALLGPSGGGKTTLLNVMGGLDKVGSGKVFVNGHQISGRPSWVVDKIRTLNIGYIFQNYNLIDNMTVFDNVALALKMTGVTNKKEIEEKVNYVLEKVGMFRYRNRYADMLSGGERQRVGIARAIVKNPPIIIADEPTGNLDSRNTLEVMNIIKAISEEKLVVLVTHEEKLANFYANRIIRISDGTVISDEINEHENDLDYRIENKFYLKDIKEHKRLKTEGYNLDFYNDTGDAIDLDIVIRNGNIYIRTNNQDQHIEIVDKNSSIELIDDNYKAMTMEETAEQAIDLKKLESKRKKRYRSILNPFTMLIKGFHSVSNYSSLKKVLLVGFVVSAMFITYAVSMFFGVLNISDDEFSGADRDYITVVGKNISVNNYRGYENNEEYSYVFPGNSLISLEMKFDDYIQTKDFVANLDGSLSSVNKLSEASIIYGRMAQDSKELVVDRMVIDSVIMGQSSIEVGAGRVRDFVDRTVEIKHMGTFKIVGITDLKTPCIYADESQFINIIANCPESSMEIQDDPTASNQEFIDYKLMKNSVRLKNGKWPEGNYEVLVNEKNKGDSAYKIGKKIKTKINGRKLKVTGYYADDYYSDYMLVNEKMVKYNLVKTKNNVTLSPYNKEAALSMLKFEGVNVKDTFEESKEHYIKQKWASMKSMLIMAAIILIISFIEIYLIIRASFLSRIREVGIYRAIGVKKLDIYRMFAGEIIAITTFASIPGFALMAFILHNVSKVSYMSDMFLVNVPMLIACVVIIYLLNLLFGLLPVYKTIRKRPAVILSRNDI